jgi:hypothetical protein
MALTKQQKFDMIYDVELRLAKEELAEQYVKNLNAIENSKKPLRTLKDIAQKDTPVKVDTEQENAIAGKALSDYQRDEWHNLSEHHFEELKAISLNVDSQELVVEQQEELKQLLARHGRDRYRVEQSETPLEEEQAVLHAYENLPDPEIMARLRQKMSHLTSEEKELMEQSEEAVKTPFKKDGLDSKTQWEFIGFESLTMKNAEKRDFNIQKDFENAQSMSNDHDMGMEL